MHVSSVNVREEIQRQNNDYSDFIVICFLLYLYVFFLLCLTIHSEGFKGFEYFSTLGKSCCTHWLSDSLIFPWMSYISLNSLISPFPFSVMFLFSMAWVYGLSHYFHVSFSQKNKYYSHSHKCLQALLLTVRLFPEISPVYLPSSNTISLSSCGNSLFSL